MKYSYTLTFAVDDANKLVIFTKTFSTGTLVFPEGLARCKKNGNILTVSSLNNHTAGVLTFKRDDMDNIPDDEEFFIMVPKKKFAKKDYFVEITATECKSTYLTALGETSLMFEEVNSYPNVERILTQPTPTLKIAFDPKLLANALNAFDGDYVEMEFTNSVSGVYIQNESGNKLAYVLPVRMK